MKTKRNLIITSLGTLVMAAVFAASGGGQTSFSVDIKSKEGIGSYLADSKGMTLYTFKKDSQKTSTCVGECSAMWPAFYSQNITVPSGLQASDFGTITRKDKKKQTTYKEMPLYYFSDDRKPGDAKGKGVHNLWFPATPSESSW